MIRRPLDAYATTVYDGFRQELKNYVEAVVRWRPRERFSELRVRIWVVTAQTLELDHAALFAHADLLLRQDLPGAVLDQVFYSIDLGTSPPDYSITIDPEPAVDTAALEDLDLPVPDGWLVLALSYDDYRAAFHLAPSRMWVPFGRGVSVKPGRMPVRLSDRVRAVPRGPLLLLRRKGEALQVRRSAERREYGVFLDGDFLEEGAVLEAAAAGTIAYAGNQGQTTHLRYRLLQES